jgi:hypothetical protein
VGAVRRLLCVAWLCVLCVISVGLVFGQTRQPDGAGLVIPRGQIDQWLRAEISRHGGAFPTERYHFIIGFSTGHFGSHPLHATAMHCVAFAMMNQTLAVGDRLTPVSWEMGLCETGDTISLTDDPASRGRLVSVVPYAPWHEGHGGHDVERTLYPDFRH